MKKHIALYGKGGIGKTTVAVNVALTLAQKGLKVLLVGCDPKQDTTRLLTDKPLPSIMDNYDLLVHKRIPPESVITNPRENLWCCEVGGPKPGVGCAGRGITISLGYLDKTGYIDKSDVVLYDVLGDVVCGGFASPVTKAYAKEIFVVSSGEQAALFAANNLISGMKAIQHNVSGIVYNQREFRGEDAIMEEFSKAVKVPVISKIPYSEEIKLGEINRKAICECEGAEHITQYYDDLADKLISASGELSPEPMKNEDLYELIRKKFYELN